MSERQVVWTSRSELVSGTFALLITQVRESERIEYVCVVVMCVIEMQR